MKNYTLLFIAIATVFSFSCFAQNSDLILVNTKTESTQFILDKIPDDGLVPVSYHVEERINMKFGGSVTSYEVSDLSLINSSDLGPNNTRTITIKYAKAKVKPAMAITNSGPLKPPVDTLAIVINPIDIVVTDKKKVYFYIKIVSTYERVLDKGYKSVDMLKMVGNTRYFEGDLVLAAKWYSQLFEMTNDLEAEYYYRYAKSLTAVCQNEKANEMMKIFENKNSQKDLFGH